MVCGLITELILFKSGKYLLFEHVPLLQTDYIEHVACKIGMTAFQAFMENDISSENEIYYDKSPEISTTFKTLLVNAIQKENYDRKKISIKNNMLKGSWEVGRNIWRL